MKNSFIIFVTSFDHYAIKAFKLNSIDYLLKPIEPSELLGAINKFKTQVVQAKQKVDALRHSLLEPSYPKRLMIKFGMQIKMILVEDVVCFYREDRGLYIATCEGKRYLLDEPSIDAILKIIDPAKFFRVNRFQVIAIEYIEQMTQMSISRLKLTLFNYQGEVIVSRERVQAFKMWLGSN